MNHFIVFILFDLFASIFGAGVAVGETWLDTKGNVIQAHGGGFLQKDGRFYWVGENKARDNSNFLGVSLYESDDLISWTYVKELLTLDTKWANNASKGICQVGKKTDGSYCLIERPKFLYNAKTDRFVIWAHWENGDNYLASHLLVAQSASGDPHSEYSVIANFRPGVGHVGSCGDPNDDPTYDPAAYKAGAEDPLTPGVPYIDGSQKNPTICYSYNPGQTTTSNVYPWGYGSRDFTVFVDPDSGEGYLISAMEHFTMRVYTLTEDYRNVDWQHSYPFAPCYAREAPALLKTEGVYYMLHSSQTGWQPNQLNYQTTEHLRIAANVDEAAQWGVKWDGNVENWWSSAWSSMQVIGSCSTYNSQPAGIIAITDNTDPGKPRQQFVYLGDRWVPSKLGSSTYIWLPLGIDVAARTARLDYITDWTISPAGKILPNNLTLLSKGKVASGNNTRAQADCGLNGASCGPEGAVDGEWCIRDNNHLTEAFFRPKGAPYKWSVDLGATYGIARVDVQYWIVSNAEGLVSSVIYGSDDGSGWTKIAESTKADPQMGFRSYKVNGRYRYIQIDVSEVVSRTNANQDVSVNQSGLVEVAVWGQA